jgi:hypothetical protein
MPTQDRLESEARGHAGGDQVPAQGGPGADQEDGRLHARVQQTQAAHC